MTADPARPPAPAGRASPARHLAAIADSLSGAGITSRLTRIGGTPVLTAGEPAAGPDHPAVTIDPAPGGQLDCTCVWTPPPGTTPAIAAAAIAAVLHAAALPWPRPQPPAADAARLAAFLDRRPGWSAFWDKRYGLWRAAEDDPGSVLHAETPDAGAVIAYITSRS